MTVLNRFSACLLAAMAVSMTGSIEANDNKFFDLDGDLRFRYQAYSQQDAPQRTRLRYRFRIGDTISINPNTDISFGLASGATDPRSTNQSLDGGFDTDGIQIDYIYSKFQLSEDETLTIGKMKNPIYRTTSIFWDGDIRPEGVAYTKSCDKARLLAGYFILDEGSSTESDPNLLMLQLKRDWKKKDRSITGALTYYNFMSIEGHTFANSANTNSSNGGLTNDMDVVFLDLIAKRKDLFGFEKASAALNVAHNTVASDKNQAVALELKIGDASKYKKGNKQYMIGYMHSERDAWLDIFPDSDTFLGRTGISGIRTEIKLGVSDSSFIAIKNFFLDSLIDSTNKYQMLMVDYTTKF